MNVRLMALMCCLFALAQGLFLSHSAVAAEREDNALGPIGTVRLSSSLTTLAKDTQSFWLLVTIDLQPGWHTYWRNPGESGMATSITLTSASELSFSDVYWQPPQRFPVGGSVSFGYENQAQHLIEVQVGEGALQTAKEVSVSGTVSWLVCKDVCLPEKATVSLQMSVADEAKASPEQSSMALLRKTAQLPVVSAQYREVGNVFDISVEQAKLLERLTLTDAAIEAVYIFPFNNDFINHVAEHIWSIKDGYLRLVVSGAGLRGRQVESGVLMIQQADGREHYVQLNMVRSE